MKRPCLLHADAAGRLADREGLTVSAALSLQNDALENLDTLTVAFLDLAVDANRVADVKLRNALLQLSVLNLLDDLIQSTALLEMKNGCSFTRFQANPPVRTSPVRSGAPRVRGPS